VKTGDVSAANDKWARSPSELLIQVVGRMDDDAVLRERRGGEAHVTTRSAGEPGDGAATMALIRFVWKSGRRTRY
jgi:hypothetical protein